MGDPEIDRDRGREERLRALLDEERRALPEMSGLTRSLAAELSRRAALIGCRVHCHGRLDRAMSEARSLVARREAEGRHAYSGTVVVARELTDGRGRMGRSWFGPPGGLYLALLLAPELVLERAGLYPLAAGVAACATLREYLPDARLKWVNDVHVGGRKICGLLAESFHSARYQEEYLLLGLGLNANIAGFPPELAGLATSLSLELQEDVDLDLLCARLLGRLGHYLALLHRYDQQCLEAELSAKTPRNPILDSFRALSDSVGRRVLYRMGDGDPGHEATVTGLADDGGLMLEDAGEACHIAHGGEILYLD
ncbi:MAG: biotin--[acetyl-CoA-carboxylase] ligase [Pseudomonadota bacterium]